VVFFQDDYVTLYCDDCRNYPHLQFDHLMTDPPYDAMTHKGVRTMAVQPSGERVGVIDVPFEPLGDTGWMVSAFQPRRWAVACCSLEMLGDYKRTCGEMWTRAGFWRRPNGAPQFTGDRPGQPGEGLAIWHSLNERRRWNGGGKHGFYEYQVVHGPKRVHPTQKPEGLMRQLVADFTDPGDLILDPFAGAGTTLVAAKYLGRRAIGIEINPEYCAFAAERLTQGVLF
jgi:site-specific DNA-methyltransferase (adenine-specific)